MTLFTLILRSLRFYWRTHLGVLAGVTVTGAILTGSLAVGDSVRFTLKQLGLARLGHVTRARLTQTMNLLILAPDTANRPGFIA